MAHPTPKDQIDGPNVLAGYPKLHLGPVASGKDIGRNSRLREAFSRQVQALAWDSPTDTVIESVIGIRFFFFNYIYGILVINQFTRMMILLFF